MVADLPPRELRAALRTVRDKLVAVTASLSLPAFLGSLVRESNEVIVGGFGSKTMACTKGVEAALLLTSLNWMLRLPAVPSTVFKGTS